MLVSGQNAVRAFSKSWPIIPGLKDPVRPMAQVEALGHWEKDLAIYLDAHPGLLDCGVQPLVDGNMNAAGVGAWTGVNGGVPSKVAVSPFEGVRNLRLDFGGVGDWGCWQAGITANQWYWVDGYARSDGFVTPRLFLGGGFVSWTGGLGAGWQHFSFPLAADGAALYLLGNGGGAGNFVEWDYVMVTPLNVTTWFDRTRRGGRNPTQATAVRKPFRAKSGSSELLRFDGTADFLKTAVFTLNQPAHYWMAFKPTATAATGYYVDGDVSNLSAWMHDAGGSIFRLKQYAGAYGAGFNGAVDGLWKISDSLLDGATSSMSINGVSATGNAGAGNPGGCTIGARGDGNVPVGMDLLTFQILNRAMSDSERQNWWKSLQYGAVRYGVII